MLEMTLQEFLDGRSQKDAAAALHIGQSAVSQMLAAGRDIRIRLDENGNVTACYEIKPIGKKAQAA